MGNTMVCFVHEAFFLLEVRCRSVIFFSSTPTNLKVFGMASDSEEEHPAHYYAFGRMAEELKELEGELAQLREGRHEDVLSESETKLADQVCSN
jgi:hypothetical protein